MTQYAIDPGAENTAILAVQTALATAKSAMRDAIQGCTDLMAIEKTAGRADAYDEAFLAREKFRRTLGQIGVDHGEASRAMNILFSNAGPIIFGGGGGR